MNMSNIKFNPKFSTTRKLYKNYAVENENDLDKAIIVGKGNFTIKEQNFDYELVLDNLFYLESELDYQNNPYVSKIKKIQEDSKKIKKVNNVLIKFIKKYGISNIDNGINVKELIERIYLTNKINKKIEDKQYIAFDEAEKYTTIRKKDFSERLKNISILIYENTKDYPVAPQLFYNEDRKKIEIKFISKSIISIANYYLLLKCADNDVFFNTCKYCGRIFKTENPRTKICPEPSNEECKRERKRLYQKEYRKKLKRKNK